jgi:hypothetical protein
MGAYLDNQVNHSFSLVVSSSGMPGDQGVAGSNPAVPTVSEQRGGHLGATRPHP